MNHPLRILGIAGSLRQGSYNRAALVAAQGLLPAEVSLTIFDLEGIPLFNQDTEGSPTPKVSDFKKNIREADAILICTPEYNYSIPGVLKNAMDCASRPFGDSAWSGKPVAVMGVSVGMFGTVRAQNHLRQSFVSLGMLPVNHPEVMIGNAAQAFDGQGVLTDDKSKTLIRDLLVNLANWAHQLKKS